MKLALFNDYQLGVIIDRQMVDATSALKGISYHTPQELMRMVVEGFSELRPKIAEAVHGKVGVPIESVRLRPPLPRPGQLACLAGNYLEPAKPERGEFNAFLKSPTAIIGSGETVELPKANATVFHFEPELSLVIGKTASRISRHDAMSYIFGYTQLIDVSARGLYRKPRRKLRPLGRR